MNDTAAPSTRLACAVVLLALFSAAPLGADEVFYVTKGSTWQYFKGTQEPSTPDTEAWREPDFDDDGWATGAAPFGYGEPITFGTELGDMRNNYSTLYLRQVFQVGDASSVDELRVNVHYEDGFVIWINGEEVFRENAPDVVDHDTFAPTTIEPTENTWEILAPFHYLVDGANVLAVQVFNTSVTTASIVRSEATLNAALKLYSL